MTQILDVPMPAGDSARSLPNKLATTRTPTVRDVRIALAGRGFVYATITRHRSQVRHLHRSVTRREEIFCG